MKHAGFLKNAALISAAGITAKGMGALYKIVLMRSLGGYGMGLYQMAYPLFCFLLTFCSAGVPSAFARMIASETAKSRGGGTALKTALRLFALLGLCACAIMIAFAPTMSALQGDKNLFYCYLALAPSVFFVALLSVLRGYFQGKNDMLPTAFSEITEQLVKVAIGLVVAQRFAGDVRGVVYSLLAVTVSEAVSLALLFVRLGAVRRTCPPLPLHRVKKRQVFDSVLPVMIAAAVLPLSQTVDSVFIVRLLPLSAARSVQLFGLFSGGALSLVNLPATVCYGLVAATVPAVSSRFARGDEEGGRRAALYSLALTLAMSSVCAVGLFAFARPIVGFLYGSLSPEDATLLVRLVRLLSVSSVTLAGVDTLVSCLTGMGRARRAVVAMTVAVLCKFVLQWLLVPELSVIGAAIAANACYLIAFFLDFMYTVRKSERQKHDHDHRTWIRARRRNVAGIEAAQSGEEGSRAKFVARIGRTERRGDPL